MKELKGEEALSFKRAQELCELAAQLAAYRPWEALLEDQLVFVHDAGRKENDVCSVMGMRGEVFALAVYLGADGYHFFRKLESSAEISTGEFFAGQRSISVEYVARKELTRPDRELLLAAGYPAARGEMVPKFRTVRPGYQPWYVTEGEARILAGCLEAMVIFCQFLARPDYPALWKLQGYYPLMTRNEGGYDIRPIAEPKAARATPAAPPLDRARIQRILDRNLGVSGVLEVDHFYSAAAVGRSHERKACLRIALAVDGASGFAFAPEVAMPETATGEMLGNVVFRAIEAARSVPREIRVGNAEYRSLVEPLARALGSQVRVVKAMPALDRAKNAVLEMMGDTGPIPLG